MRILLGFIAALTVADAALATPFRTNDGPVFTQTLNNIYPLDFGMSADGAARALGAPLNYLHGRPGEETFLVIRTHGGSGLLPREDRLFLQFRRGRLSGLKGDWGRNWMWR